MAETIWSELVGKRVLVRKLYGGERQSEVDELGPFEIEVIIHEVSLSGEYVTFEYKSGAQYLDKVEDFEVVEVLGGEEEQGE